LTSIASLIAAAEKNEAAAGAELFAALYQELHRLAQRELARRGSGASLGVTTLLHEAYLDMAERDAAAFPDRARFMGYAARVMRGLIIDHARSRHAVKRGGQFEITSLDTNVVENVAESQDLSNMSDALNDLARTEPGLAEVVDLKFFCGFSFAEIAAMQGIAERTVQRKWEKARIYLHRTLRSTSLM
jgi:RNA polymerase sigma factor (TIGR02999 family)